MRLDGRRNSNNVVDRRSSGKALGIGGGIVGVIVAGIITLLSGGNIGDVLQTVAGSQNYGYAANYTPDAEVRLSTPSARTTRASTS